MFGVHPINRTTINVTAKRQYTGEKFHVSKLFDGSVRTNASDCACCGAVESDTWIEIELPRRYLLDHIIIQGRSDSTLILIYCYVSHFYNMH